LSAHDLKQLLADLPFLEVVEGVDPETLDHDASFKQVASFDGGGIYLGRFRGESPWELHPSGDELLHPIEGEVEVVYLREEEPKRFLLKSGQVCVVPKGVWHKQISPGGVGIYSVTPEPSEVSFEEDPRNQETS